MSKFEMVSEGLRERIEALGYKYIGAELVTENAIKILRVYADCENNLDIDDCEKISRMASEFLDLNEGALPVRYFLEVSSPGLERPLFSTADYREFMGKKVFLKLKGQKKLTGVIKDVSEEDLITIADDQNKETRLPFSEIRQGRLVFIPETGEKKTFKKIPKKKDRKKK